MTEAPEAPRLLSLKSVLDKTSLSESQIRRLMAAEEFPKPRRLTRNRIGWVEPEVNGWIVSKLTANPPLEAA